MVQEKQLKELFKYIEANWDVCVEDVDKRDIKRIFGGVLCDDIMNDTDQVTDQEPEQVAEPTKQASSQVKLDNSFDRERFEAMFSSMVAREPHWTYKDCMIETEKLLKQLDAYYAKQEGGNNG